MNKLSLFSNSGPRKILVLGAHSDDIEIGCGGTLLRLAGENDGLEVLWVVFCATGERATEAAASAAAFLDKIAQNRVEILGFREAYMPYQGSEVKDKFEALKSEFAPELILTHYRQDQHQDHRLVSDLTWNTWRDHLILEYEVPKYDGDFGNPNFYSPLEEAVVDRKIELILRHFPSQLNKHWLSTDLLRAVARIRGMECGPSAYFAEAFYCRKALF